MKVNPGLLYEHGLGAASFSKVTLPILSGISYVTLQTYIGPEVSLAHFLDEEN